MSMQETTASDNRSLDFGFPYKSSHCSSVSVGEKLRVVYFPILSKLKLYRAAARVFYSQTDLGQDHTVCNSIQANSGQDRV